MAENNCEQKIAKSEITKQRIIESYLKLIKKKHWDKISVKEICTEANITRTTFYQYYTDIFDAMERIQTKHLTALDALSQDCHLTPVPVHITSLEDFVPYFTASANFFHVWYSYCSKYRLDFLALCHPVNGDEYFRKRLKTLLCHYINQTIDQDGFPEDDLRPYFLDLQFNIFFQNMYNWLATDNGKYISIEELCDIQNCWRIGSTCQRLIEPYKFEKELPH